MNIFSLNRFYVFTIVFVLFMISRGFSQFTKTGPEITIDSQAGTFTNNASLAMDYDGNFVATWAATTDTMANRDNEDIYARLYNSIGEPLGEKFIVNSTTVGRQNQPGIAMDSLGNFVITWQGLQDGNDHYRIFAQRFNASGVAQGSEFQVNEVITSPQIDADVAMNKTGDFVITWNSDYNIFAKRYSANGIVQGGAFQINTLSQINRNPKIAISETGDFVITWQNNSGSYWDTYVRRYDTLARAKENEFRVSQNHLLGNQCFPTVAINKTGDFTISFLGQFYPEEYNSQVYISRYDSSGTALEEDILVSLDTFFTINQNIGMDKAGNAVVAWEGQNDGNNINILAQSFDEEGNPENNTFECNDAITDYSSGTPSVAVNRVTGDFIISWSTYDDSARYTGIYAQRWARSSVTSITKSSSSLFSVYPNPASKEVTISVKAPATLRIIDAMGQVVLNSAVNQDLSIIPLENYRPGLYIVQVMRGDEHQEKQIVVGQ